MSRKPWERTCKRCGRPFEVALWCREVAYCDTCQEDLDAQGREAQVDQVGRHDDGPQKGRQRDIPKDSQ